MMIRGIIRDLLAATLVALTIMRVLFMLGWVYGTHYDDIVIISHLNLWMGILIGLLVGFRIKVSDEVYLLTDKDALREEWEDEQRMYQNERYEIYENEE